MAPKRSPYTPQRRVTRMLCRPLNDLHMHLIYTFPSRNIIRPSVQSPLAAISASFALEISKSIANASTLSTLMETSPQTITTPISYTVDNLVPFDIPVFVKPSSSSPPADVINPEPLLLPSSACYTSLSCHSSLLYTKSPALLLPS